MWASVSANVRVGSATRSSYHHCIQVITLHKQKSQTIPPPLTCWRFAHKSTHIPGPREGVTAMGIMGRQAAARFMRL